MYPCFGEVIPEAAECEWWGLGVFVSEVRAFGQFNRMHLLLYCVYKLQVCREYATEGPLAILILLGRFGTRISRYQILRML